MKKTNLIIILTITCAFQNPVSGASILCENTNPFRDLDMAGIPTIHSLRPLPINATSAKTTLSPPLNRTILTPHANYIIRSDTGWFLELPIHGSQLSPDTIQFGVASTLVVTGAGLIDAEKSNMMFDFDDPTTGNCDQILLKSTSSYSSCLLYRTTGILNITDYTHTLIIEYPMSVTIPNASVEEIRAVRNHGIHQLITPAVSSEWSAYNITTTAATDNLTLPSATLDYSCTINAEIAVSVSSNSLDLGSSHQGESKTASLEYHVTTTESTYYVTFSSETSVSNNGPTILGRTITMTDGDGQRLYLNTPYYRHLSDNTVINLTLQNHGGAQGSAEALLGITVSIN